METWYCVEHLNTVAWFTQILPYLVRDRRGGVSKRIIYFIDATRSGLTLARVAAWFVGVSVSRLDFRLSDIHDQDGLWIRLRVESEDLAEVQRDAVAEPVFQKFTKEARETLLPAYLAKTIAVLTSASPKLFDRGAMWRALLLVQICNWTAKKEVLLPGNVVLFMVRRPWSASIARYGARYGVTLVWVAHGFDVRRLIRGLLTPHGIAFMRMIRAQLYNLQLRFRRETGQFDESAGNARGRRLSNSGPYLAVPYGGHLNIDHPERYSDLSFLQQSSLQGSDVMLTFGFPQDPLDKEKMSELFRYGIHAMPLYPGASTIPSKPLFVHTPSARRTRYGDHLPLRMRRSLEGRWLRWHASTYDELKDYWYDLCARENIRAHLTWYRYDANHFAITEALRRLNGVSAIYQHSYHSNSSPELTVNADIMFDFSPQGVHLERDSGSQISYHVAVGYIGDHHIALLRQQAAKVRQDLQQRGAKYIVAYFDENSSYDPRWAGHEFTRTNYQFILEKLNASPWLGLVLKPKYPPSLRRRLGPVAGLLEAALSTGRCFIFEDGAFHGSYPPAAAALASDVAIHGHLCAGSAGFESALAGVPTLLLDREGWHISPLYQLGVGRVVFRSWDDLWTACMEHVGSPLGVPGFGDWGNMLNMLDPFRDGKAAQRMGTYLKWVLDGLKAGGLREAVLANAAERYGKIWGADKITEVKG